MADNIIDLDPRIKTVALERKDTSTTYLTCDYGAALLMKVHENGDVESISMRGEVMDKLVKSWLEYRESKPLKGPSATERVTSRKVSCNRSFSIQNALFKQDF